MPSPPRGRLGRGGHAGPRAPKSCARYAVEKRKVIEGVHNVENGQTYERQLSIWILQPRADAVGFRRSFSLRMGVPLWALIFATFLSALAIISTALS